MKPRKALESLSPVQASWFIAYRNEVNRPDCDCCKRQGRTFIKRAVFWLMTPSHWVPTGMHAFCAECALRRLGYNVDVRPMR